MTSGIYEIINIITERRYVGSAVNIEKRWMKHKNLLDCNNHHSLKLQNAWNKYGKDNFKFEILYECDKSELLFCEQNWLDFYGIENLYNICPIAGSSLGRKHSDETKRKISEIQIGKKTSSFTKRKIQLARNGYPVIQIDMEGNVLGRYESVNEAARQTGINSSAISSSARRYIKCNVTLFVKLESDIELALQKNREKCKNRKITNANNGAINGKKSSKPIYQIDRNTNQIIKIWNSARDVERKLGINNSNISQCALGKLKSAGGYIWHYIGKTNYQKGDIYPL